MRCVAVCAWECAPYTHARFRTRSYIFTCLDECVLLIHARHHAQHKVVCAPPHSPTRTRKRTQLLNPVASTPSTLSKTSSKTGSSSDHSGNDKFSPPHATESAAEDDDSGVCCVCVCIGLCSCVRVCLRARMPAPAPVHPSIHACIHLFIQKAYKQTYPDSDNDDDIDKAGARAGGSSSASSARTGLDGGSRSAWQLGAGAWGEKQKSHTLLAEATSLLAAGKGSLSGSIRASHGVHKSQMLGEKGIGMLPGIEMPRMTGSASPSPPIQDRQTLSHTGSQDEDDLFNVGERARQRGEGRVAGGFFV